MKSFTLIEILLYLAIVSVVLVVGTTFIWQVIEGGERASQLEELRTNSNFVLEKMSYEIKRADQVLVPLSGYSKTCPENDTEECLKICLVSDNPCPSASTIRFFRQAETDLRKIYQKTGENTAVALTPSSVNITSLTVTNLSPDKGPGTLRLSMTLQHQKNSRVTFTTHSSVSLRDN